MVEGHPNRLPFEGVLTLVDVASDRAPSGSRGHRVVLTHEAAEQALPSPSGHGGGLQGPAGTGTTRGRSAASSPPAAIEGKRLTVAAISLPADYPEMEQKMQTEGAMGMSYELADAHVADMRASVWTLTRATFTGAAILLRDKAAYRNTSFRLKRAVLGHVAAKPVASRNMRQVA